MDLDFAKVQRLQLDKVTNVRVTGVRRVPSNRQRPGLTAHFVGSKVYIVCGTVLGVARAIVSVLDISSSTWRDITIPYALARGAHVSFLWNDYIYVYGGYKRKILTDYFRIDLLDEGNVESFECSWDETFYLDYLSGSFCEPAREFILFGGKWLGYVISNRTFALRIDKNVFFEPRVKGQKPAARFNHATCSVANKLYVYGGRNRSEEFSDVFVLTVFPGSYTWSEVSPSTGLRAVATKMTGIGDFLFICGGYKESIESIESLRIYSLRKNRFLSVGNIEGADIRINDAISLQSAHAVVSNSRMIVVFGGIGMNLREYWTIHVSTDSDD